jgi:hypothetical protein
MGFDNVIFDTVKLSVGLPGFPVHRQILFAISHRPNKEFQVLVGETHTVGVVDWFPVGRVCNVAVLCQSGIQSPTSDRPQTEDRQSPIPCLQGDFPEHSIPWRKNLLAHYRTTQTSQG